MGRGAWKRGQYQQSATNWQTGYAGAQAALTQGVANPSRDPTAAAIANVNGLIAGFNAATTGGANSQWAQALRRAGQAGWAAGMTAFASSGLSQKASKGMPHFAAFAAQYGPAVTAYAAQLPARGAVGSNAQRSVDMQNWEHSQRGKYKKLWRGG
jgi:imidazolonepropionase-like amidohydrolase